MAMPEASTVLRSGLGRKEMETAIPFHPIAADCAAAAAGYQPYHPSHHTHVVALAAHLLAERSLARATRGEGGREANCMLPPSPPTDRPTARPSIYLSDHARTHDDQCRRGLDGVGMGGMVLRPRPS